MVVAGMGFCWREAHNLGNLDDASESSQFVVILRLHILELDGI